MAKMASDHLKFVRFCPTAPVVEALNATPWTLPEALSESMEITSNSIPEG
jgi:hypothetical protein